MNVQHPGKPSVLGKAREMVIVMTDISGMETSTVRVCTGDGAILYASRVLKEA